VLYYIFQHEQHIVESWLHVLSLDMCPSCTTCNRKTF